MTNEQKAAVERAAEVMTSYESIRMNLSEGMQRVIDNPGEFGLVTAQQYYDNKGRYEKHLAVLCDKEVLLESQLAKYREALERILQGNCSPILVAKEALKQEDTTCPKCGYPLFKHLGKACCQGCDYVKQQ